MWDLNMYHETLDVEGEKVEMPMLARSTDLNEELGLVSHVFTDKTGTLTCNVMEFLKCTIGEHSYGLGLTQIGRAWRERNGLEIVEPPPQDPDEPRTPYVNIICPKLKVCFVVWKGSNTRTALTRLIAQPIYLCIQPCYLGGDGRPRPP